MFYLVQSFIKYVNPFRHGVADVRRAHPPGSVFRDRHPGRPALSGAAPLHPGPVAAQRAARPLRRRKPLPSDALLQRNR